MVQLVQELGLPELSAEQMEQLCSVAEEAAREYILSTISKKDADRLDVIVEAEGTKPLNLKVEIDLVLSSSSKIDSTTIVNEAVKEAFKASETFLRKLT
jgi:hypothetical protein